MRASPVIWLRFCRHGRVALLTRCDACVTQHAQSTKGSEWWSTTFRDAIRDMGHTVMVLAPWRKPVPLTRAW